MKTLYNKLKIALSYFKSLLEEFLVSFWKAITSIIAYVCYVLWATSLNFDKNLNFAVLVGTLFIFVYFVTKGIKSFHKPSLKTTLRDVEKTNKLSSGSFDFIDDRAATGSEDFFKAEQKKLSEKFPWLRSKYLQIKTYKTDPMAFRFVFILLFIITITFHHNTITAKQFFDRAMPWPTVNFDFLKTPPPQLTGWITPPSYMDEPAQTLSFETASPLIIWNNSEIKLSISDISNDALYLNFYDDKKPEAFNRIEENNFALTRDVKIDIDYIQILDEDEDVIQEWSIFIEEDTPATIGFDQDITVTPKNKLDIKFFAQDDFGLSNLSLKITPLLSTVLDPNPEPMSIDITKSLIRADDQDVRVWQGQYYADLRDHPWAGLPVKISLHGTDLGGNDVESETQEVTLPVRNFDDPIAQKIIEIRSILIDDYRKNKTKAFADLEEIIIYPDRYRYDKSVFLGLKAAIMRLYLDRFDRQLKSTAQLLWDIAVYLEDGKIDQLNEQLSAVEDMLKQALKNENATNKQLERLVNQYRNALENLARETLRQAYKDAKEKGQEIQVDPITSLALNKSLMDDFFKALSQAAQSGDKDAAMDLLKQLRQALENSEPTQKLSKEQQAALNHMRELSQIIDIQTQILEKTKAQKAKETDLVKNREIGLMQNELTSMLSDLIKDYADLLKDTDTQNFKSAEQDMQTAASELLKDDISFDNAIIAQESALRNLNKALDQALSDIQNKLNLSISKGDKTCSGGMGNSFGLGNNGSRSANLDPFGRQEGFENRFSKGLEFEEEQKLKKVREIIQELRNRSGDYSREKYELDYIKRLLEKF